MSRPSIEVVILAGGQSSRMGRDKARLRLARRSLLGHARDAARALNLPVRVIRRDRISRCGPLGGIYTALKSSRAEAVLFLACDMPFLTAALMRRLLRSFRAGDAASFATLRRRVGFPFVIHTRCGPLVKKEILLGRLSLQQLAVALKARRMSISLSQSAALFNINTPEDLAAALRQAQDEARRGRKR